MNNQDDSDNSIPQEVWYKMPLEQRPEKLSDKIAELLTSVTTAALHDIGRPKNIPACVPDCGWNHGEGALRHQVLDLRC
jgi:hypothetical protein